MQQITEASSTITAPVQKIVSADMEVFYNPVMRLNRDFTILLLAAWKRKELKVGSPLAGSGIRELRMVNELNEDKIKIIYLNDWKQSFKKYFENNIKINKLSKSQKSKLITSSSEANLFMHEKKPFDYIDIDPFGTPNPFLDSAVQCIKNNGIIAVTATDTSALCGSYPSACRRKYWAEPLRNEWMHEFGLRILIRKAQLIGAQHEMALYPVFSYAYHHYARVFFLAINNRKKTDEILRMHIPFLHDKKLYGPVWVGELNDDSMLDEMRKESKKMNNNIGKETIKLLETISEESKIKSIFFHDIHGICRKNKSASMPRFDDIMNELRKKGFKASRTHFSEKGIKTDADEKAMMNIISSLNKDR